MNRRSGDMDFITLFLMLGLALFGWLTIYAVSTGSEPGNLFDLSRNHGRQFVWILIATVVAVVIMALDSRFLEGISYLAYGFSLLLLIVVLFIGREVNGAKGWLVIGSVQFQPAELAKVGTAMALARLMSQLNFSLKNRRQLLTAAAIVLAPALVVILQNDTGSALVFGSLLIVFFREGLSPLVPIALVAVGATAIATLWSGNPLVVSVALLALGFVAFLWLARSQRRKVGLFFMVMAAALLLAAFSWSVDTIVHKYLQPHQQNRIMVLFDPEVDPQGAGYNVKQSKIAIGSGGFWGKGFLEGNYTKYEFVPKQVTDFIYCTVGEERGWVGSVFLIGMFFLLLMRVRFIAENAKTRYARVYGYSVLSIVFFHVAINVGMTIGLAPVIGIPLPFFSYGGSSLLAFTVLITVLVNLYSFRSAVLGAKA